MLTPAKTTQFKKDYKLAKKRGKNLDELKKIMTLLVEEKELPLKNRDHALSGKYANRRECHINPDWLLIYRIEFGIIFFERTGTHSDLFK